MLRFRSLNERLSVFILFPVAVLLIAMGYAGFIYARDSMLAQWRESTILMLQQTAHRIDMRLSRPKESIKMFYKTSGKNHGDHHVQQWVIDQLENLEGVDKVELEWLNGPADDSPQKTDRQPQMQPKGKGKHMPGIRMDEAAPMRFHGGHITKITAPRYNSSRKHETISLISDLLDEGGRKMGRLEVRVRTDYLFEDIEESGFWQSSRAYLVDAYGSIIQSTTGEEHKKLFHPEDPIGLRTIYAMRSLSYGTVFGPGNPPASVSGFYQLQEAPWSLVMMAPGAQILNPIVRFRWYYLISGLIFIGVILVLIRWMTGRTVLAIKNLSNAAKKVARGNYGDPLPVKSDDEVGELTHSFNSMVQQLEERIRLKEALNLAMEVQQNLLPKESLKIGNLEIAGHSNYCDETGGDYYDFFQFPELGGNRVGIAIGDVVGHGVAAALLMTTARALLRMRITKSGSLAETISDVNQHLCFDTVEAGNFMTLFLMLIDVDKNKIKWVRAGHDPAIVYDTATDTFKELKGEGMALGIECNQSFQEYEYTGWSDGQIILLGTDGIWETENPEKERFGIKRVQEILRLSRDDTAQQILQKIIDETTEFRKSEKQNDDITLVVMKIR